MGVSDRVSRYWQVFKLRHRQSVLTAAALHSMQRHTHTVDNGRAEVAVSQPLGV